MSPRGPWYIAASAVRDYLALRGRPVVDDGPAFDAASDELVALAIACADKEPRVLPSGAHQYRAPRPLRYRLIVRAEPRPEGPLPQLVAVLPAHD